MEHRPTAESIMFLARGWTKNNSARCEASSCIWWALAHLHDDLAVGHHHGDAPEERLQVLRQLLPPSISCMQRAKPRSVGGHVVPGRVSQGAQGTMRSCMGIFVLAEHYKPCCSYRTGVHGDEEADTVVQRDRRAVSEQELLLALSGGRQDAVHLHSSVSVTDLAHRSVNDAGSDAMWASSYYLAICMSRKLWDGQD